MKKSTKIIGSLIMAAAFVFASCASTSSTGDKKSSNKNTKKAKGEPVELFDAAVDVGDLDSAVSALQGEKENKNDAIRQTLNVAILQHFAKDYDNSITGLSKANTAMMDAVTKSVTKGALAAVATENAAEYSGTIYENHYVNVFNALNYYDKGDIDNAVAQIKDLLRKQETFDQISEATVKDSNSDKDEFASEEKTDDTKKDKKAIFTANDAAKLFGINLDNLKKKCPKKPTSNDQFTYSPTERYVAVMLYAQQVANPSTPTDVKNVALDEIDRQSKLLKSVNNSYDVDADKNIPADEGRLNVLAFSGLIGRREQQNLYYPGDFDAKFAGDAHPELAVMRITVDGVEVPDFNFKFTYPKFDEKAADAKNKVAKVVIAVEGKDPVTIPVLENFNDSVAKDVTNKARKDFTRSIARSITEKAAAASTSAAAIKTLQDNGSPAILVNKASKGLTVAMAAVDNLVNADTRQVITLPAISNAGGINLAPGTYNVKIQYYGKDNSLISEEGFNGVKIEAGKPAFIESSCLR